MTIYDCPECGNGKLKREAIGWRCNGLADPGHPNLPLEACEYWAERLPTRTELLFVKDETLPYERHVIDLRSTSDGEGKV